MLTGMYRLLDLVEGTNTAVETLMMLIDDNFERIL